MRVVATYGDLSKFTSAELLQMRLTHKDPENLSFNELLRLAQIRLERFQPKTQSEGFLSLFLQPWSLKLRLMLWKKP